VNPGMMCPVHARSNEMPGIARSAAPIDVLASPVAVLMVVFCAVVSTLITGAAGLKKWSLAPVSIIAVASQVVGVGWVGLQDSVSVASEHVRSESKTLLATATLSRPTHQVVSHPLFTVCHS
jgi:hypothetical protein